MVVGGRGGFIKRFGEVTPFRKMFYSKDKRMAAEKLLLAISQKPLSKEKILEQTHLSPGEFDDISSLLLSLNMVASVADTWVTTLPVITDQEMSALRETLSPLADNIAVDVTHFIPQIKNTYDEYRSSSDPEWEKVAHLFISYFMLDISLLGSLRALENKKGFRQYYSEKQKIIPAFFLETGKNFTNFGCNSYSFVSDDKKIRVFVFVLHGTLFDRIQIQVNRYENNLDFKSALFRLIPQDGNLPLSDKEKKILEPLEWIEEGKLMVPVMDGNVRKHLSSITAKAAENAAEKTFKNFGVILDAFQRSPYSKFLDGAGDYIQYSYHILMYLSIEKLIERGLLPPIPRPVPSYFGTYIIYSRSD